jgi:DNA recombination protein RmuC
MLETLISITALLVLIVLFLQFSQRLKTQTALDKTSQMHERVLKMETRFDSLERNYERIDKNVRDEIGKNREEARQSRENITAVLNNLNESLINRLITMSSLQQKQLDSFSNQLNSLIQSNENKLDAIRKTVEEKLRAFETSVNSRMQEMLILVNNMTQNNEQKMESLRATIEQKLTQIQEDNSKKLEEMRATVDEKLHNTLEQRLNQSFKLVSERLEQVYKGLGEMQSLAVGVGDLKKVLSNVKTRGIFGEIQLANILEEILTPDQYLKNVSTKKGSKEVVEFAVKLPGPDDRGSVLLPIDAKFPQEDYIKLLDAYEAGDPVQIENAGKALERRIKEEAKDICTKYISVPETTDFGIMFLATESLYAEVLRRPGLVESIQKDYKVNITGPSTLAAFLNSLAVGFRTLAIQKHSSEIWKVLGAVKTEFNKYSQVLEHVQKNLLTASNTINQAKTMTRAIERKLRSVEELPEQEAASLLGDSQDFENLAAGEPL